MKQQFGTNENEVCIVELGDIENIVINKNGDFCFVLNNGDEEPPGDSDHMFTSFGKEGICATLDSLSELFKKHNAEEAIHKKYTHLKPGDVFYFKGYGPFEAKAGAKGVGNIQWRGHNGLWLERTQATIGKQKSDFRIIGNRDNPTK